MSLNVYLLTALVPAILLLNHTGSYMWSSYSKIMMFTFKPRSVTLRLQIYITRKETTQDSVKKFRDQPRFSYFSGNQQPDLLYQN